MTIAPVPAGRIALAVVLAAGHGRCEAGGDHPASRGRALRRRRRRWPRSRHARARLPRNGRMRARRSSAWSRSSSGQGHGRWLLAEAVRLAWREGVERVHVHTCTLDHPAALAAYRRAGFVPYKRAVERFPDPRLLGPAERLRASGPADRLRGRLRHRDVPGGELNDRSAPASPANTTVTARDRELRDQRDDQRGNGHRLRRTEHDAGKDADDRADGHHHAERRRR